MRNLRRNLVIGTFAIAACVGAVSVTRAATASDDPASPISSVQTKQYVGARGLPAGELSDQDKLLLEPVEKAGNHFGSITLLGTEGDRAYYRLDNQTGADCFAVGPADPTGDRLGQVICAPTFPSSTHPILDFSVWHGDLLWRSEGIVADGVKAVSMFDPNGSVIAEVSVTNNIYSFVGFTAQKVAEIVAQDVDGNKVGSIGFPIR